MARKTAVKLSEEISYLFSDGGAVEAVKFPPLSMVFSPIADFVGAFWRALPLYLICALALSAVSMALGQDYLCGFDYARPRGLWCADSPFAFLANFALRFALIAAFMVKYNDIAGTDGAGFDFSIDWKRSGKAAALGIAFFAINALPALSVYLLYIREPNPDYRIELLYFAAVSIGFIVPILAVRWYCLFGFALGGEALPPLRFAGRRAMGNTAVILVALFALTIPAVFGFSALNSIFSANPGGAILNLYFISELLYNTVLLLFISIFANHCRKQREFLKIKGEKNG